MRKKINKIVIPIVKPEIVFIEELLEDIAAGALRLPAFPRSFVWEPKDMLELFLSISKGYPIGAPLVWDSEEPQQSAAMVGPIKIPARAGHTYILDGRQRLTTLFGCLRLPAEAPKDPELEQWQWWIYYDLKRKEFVHPKNKPVPAHFFPIRAALKTVDFLKVTRKITAECDQPEELIVEAEALAQKLKVYKLAVNRIKGGDLSQAVEIFSLLNTMGAPLKPDQMISALTYKGEGKPHLEKSIDDILVKLGEYNFESLSRMTILQGICAAAGIRIHKTDWKGIAKVLDKSLPETLKKAEKAILNAARFLAEKLNVPGNHLLPYANQMFLLSVFFGKRAVPNETQIQALKKWFWATSFAGRYGGANSTIINNAIKEIERFANGEVNSLQAISAEERALIFPCRFDIRSARIRAMLLLQLEQKPLSPQTGEPLNVYENQKWYQIFPKGAEASRLGNRILIPKIPGQSIKTQLSEIPEDIRDKVLKSHSISPEAYTAFCEDRSADFIYERERVLDKLEHDFMAKWDITPAKESEHKSAD